MKKNSVDEFFNSLSQIGLTHYEPSWASNMSFNLNATYLARFCKS